LEYRRLSYPLSVITLKTEYNIGAIYRGEKSQIYKEHCQINPANTFTVSLKDTAQV